MQIYNEIDLNHAQHDAIEQLRNRCFPEHVVPRSYYKQRPHMRALTYDGDRLVGHMGLDYRVIRVGEHTLNVLGVIDLCIDPSVQRQGLGSQMLAQLKDYASIRPVDFIILISDLYEFYTANGFRNVAHMSSWLRINEHQNFGVGVDLIDDLYVQPISGKPWPKGHFDWLGYLF